MLNTRKNSWELTHKQKNLLGNVEGFVARRQGSSPLKLSTSDLMNQIELGYDKFVVKINDNLVDVKSEHLKQGAGGALNPSDKKIRDSILGLPTE